MTLNAHLVKLASWKNPNYLLSELMLMFYLSYNQSTQRIEYAKAMLD